ncbi:MAG: hypothetical protein LBO04_00610 [Spirochaetaceae bacterium]|nr:hypothetical protein [Spirochaetaceae bacterium]
MLKFRALYLFFLCLALVAPPAIRADPNILYFEKSGIVQRISWDAVEDVFQYEFVIEKKDEGAEADGFTPLLSVVTGETSAELSLAPGEYRYRVVVYDLLGRMRPPPDWARLTVIPALQPKIFSVDPPVVGLSGGRVHATLRVTGGNLVPGAEVCLKPADGGEPLFLDGDGYVPGANGNSAELRFDGLPLKEGFYDIVITNPGGISDSWHNFSVAVAPKKTKPFDITFAEAYTPLFSSYGLINEYLGQSVFPAGASLRFGMAGKNKRYGVFGVEAQFFWHYFYSEYTILISGQLFNAQLNLLYQKLILRRKAAFNVRAGGGFAYYMNLQIKTDNDLLSLGSETLLPMAAGSVSFSWFFRDLFFLELGCEFIHIFSVEKPQPAYFRPQLCFGFRL